MRITSPTRWGLLAAACGLAGACLPPEPSGPRTREATPPPRTTTSTPPPRATTTPPPPRTTTTTTVTPPPRHAAPRPRTTTRPFVPRHAAVAPTCSAGRGNCPRGTACISDGRSLSGVCLPRCRKPSDCGAGMRCTGDVRRGGVVGQYCRPARVAVGGSCARAQDGCRPGLECFGGTCHKTCRDRLRDCTKAERCVGVQGPGRPPRTFSVCLPATKKRGDRCAPNSPPFCAVRHYCHAKRCVLLCTRDASCPRGTKCRGKGSDYRFCR